MSTKHLIEGSTWSAVIEISLSYAPARGFRLNPLRLSILLLLSRAFAAAGVSALPTPLQLTHDICFKAAELPTSEHIRQVLNLFCVKNTASAALDLLLLLLLSAALLSI